MSQSLSCQPSQILHVSNRLESFFFDRAVWRFGTSVENDLEQVRKRRSKSSAKQLEIWENQVVQKWINPDGPGRFKDPAKTAR